jgi:hypothetical protein
MAQRDIAEEYLERYVCLLKEVSATGRRWTRDEIESRRMPGERSAKASLSLRALARAGSRVRIGDRGQMPTPADLPTFCAVIIDQFAKAAPKVAG